MPDLMWERMAGGSNRATGGCGREAWGIVCGQGRGMDCMAFVLSQE